MPINPRAFAHLPAKALGAIAEHAPEILPQYTPPEGAFIGTSGQDIFYATPDADLFVFDYESLDQHDVIVDFDAGEDLIVFVNWDFASDPFVLVRFDNSTDVLNYNFDVDWQEGGFGYIIPETGSEIEFVNLTFDAGELLHGEIHALNGYGWAGFGFGLI